MLQSPIAGIRLLGPVSGRITSPMMAYEYGMQPRKQRKVLARAGLAAWLGAFAVLMLQLQLATHLNLDHDALFEAGDNCEVCLKLDANGKAPAVAESSVAIVPSVVPLSLAETASVGVRRDRTTSARAPPRA